jgi:hypothetical protein
LSSRKCIDAAQSCADTDSRSCELATELGPDDGRLIALIIQNAPLSCSDGGRGPGAEQDEGIERVVYKCVPHIYHSHPASPPEPT